MIKKLLNKIGESVYNYINREGWLSCIIVAILSNICAMLPYYIKDGFNLKIFITLELPLYIFCIWIWYNIFKMIKNNKDIFKL